MIATNHRQALDAIIRKAPRELDLTTESHLDQVIRAADQIAALYQTREALDNLEKDFVAQKDDHPLSVHLSIKLAKSKTILAAIDTPVHISVVFAVYKEHNRIRTREEHEHGENFLLRKIAQLEWLCSDRPNITWNLFIVDDGDPMKSGLIAQEILAANYSGDNVQILFLEEAIRQGLPVTKPMKSPDESQKGGALAYGMWVAAQQERPNHIILFTDADLSTHLGQIGLLVDEIVNQGCDAAIGSRREERSIAIKKGVRNLRGRFFIYLWKRLIPDLNYIVDTQCGFKAFKADLIRDICQDLIEKKFAFDIEVLLKTELNRRNAIAKVPIAWIDSEAASTTTHLQPYLTMLKGIVQIYRRYLPPNPESETFAQFIEGLDEAQWKKLVANIPREITTRDPSELADYNRIRVSDLKAIL